MNWTNEDVRDEIYEQDEEEDEGPSWVDDKGKILEAKFWRPPSASTSSQSIS